MRSYLKILTLIIAAMILSSCSLFWNNEIFIETISIEADDENGTTYPITQAGRYRFKIIGGALEVCPIGSIISDPEFGGWKTEILIYKNRPIEWEHGSIGDPIGYTDTIGSAEYQTTEAIAVENTTERSWDAYLRVDTYVLLMANDSKGNFSDNSGTMDISIYSLE